jgi:hypothetical protein
MLAFHGRIARKPAGRWVGDLLHQSEALDEQAETRESVVATCGVYNQASLVFFLLGDVPKAAGVLDMQKAYLERRRSWLQPGAYLAAMHQIRVNEIRIERVAGSPAAALASVRRALAEGRDETREALKQDDPELYRSHEADLQVELCKLLVKIGDAASAEECVRIGLSEDTGQVQRAVCLESAALLYLANGQSTPFQRLLSRLPQGDPARRIFLLRRVEHESSEGGALAAIQLAPKLLSEVRALAAKEFDFIDYLHFIDFACSLFRTIGLRQYHREALRCLRLGARRARDIVFYCSSSAQLAAFDAGPAAGERIARKRAFSRRCYPVFGGPEARRKIGTDRLLDRLTQLQTPQRAAAGTGSRAGSAQALR